MPVNPRAEESKDEFISRCISEEISGGGYESEQAAAICYSYWDKDKMSKIKDTSAKVMASVVYNSKYRGIKLADDGLEGACWEGYVAIGTKMMDGREVPNCVPEEDK